MNVYFISGLGANAHAFEYLQIPKEYTPYFIEWKLPEPKETLAHYAERMAAEIDTTQPFVLVGLSFGGIMAQEMHRYVRPQKTILISSIKSAAEKPFLLKLGKFFRAYKWLPMWFFTSDHLLSYAMLRKLYSRKMPSLEKIFTHRDAYYLRWSIHQILHWEKQIETPNLYHIHGQNDFVFPSRNIQDALWVPKGTHLMVIQQHKVVSKIMKELLRG